jgi:O-antigen ligase
MIPKRISLPSFSKIKSSLKKIDLKKVLFFLVILFLPTQLGKHFWPEFSYIYSLRIDYLSPTLYFWDLLVLMLITTWALERPRMNKSAQILFLFFLLTQSVSLVHSQNIGAGLVRLQQFFLVGVFGLYIASSSFSKIKIPLFLGLLAGVSSESLIGVGQFLKGSSLGFWLFGERSFSISTPSIANFNFFGKIFLRPYATFSHPNVFAGYLSTALPLLVFLQQHIKKHIRLLNLTLVISFSAGILTFSRISIMALIIEATFIMRRKIKWLLILLILIFPVIFTRFNSALSFDSLSLIRRGDLAEIAIIQFYQSPIFGSGLNNFINQVSTSSLVSGPSRFLQPVHNIFLLTLSETGILGFVGFMLFIGYPLLKLWKKRDLIFSKYLFFAWGILIFLGMFDHYFLTLPQGQRIFFLIWGLSMLEYSGGDFGPDTLKKGSFSAKSGPKKNI